MARDDTPIKLILVALVVVLIGYMILTFGGINTFSVVNLQGKDTVRAGEEQTYHISLTTVNPEQFTTPLHYRKQVGIWQIENANGTLLSPGKITDLTGGKFDQEVTIQIPYGFSQIVFVTKIIEYQYSAAQPQGPWLQDTGTVRVTEKLPINIVQCEQHADCNIYSTCLGQFGYCSNNLCEVKGTCKECIANTDCPNTNSTTYECNNFKCMPLVQPTLLDNFKETFKQPITEPAPVNKQGDKILAPEAPPFLTAGVFGLMVVLVYILYKRRS
jgi:hypothetical protein